MFGVVAAASEDRDATEAVCLATDGGRHERHELERLREGNRRGDRLHSATQRNSKRVSNVANQVGNANNSPGI